MKYINTLLVSLLLLAASTSQSFAASLTVIEKDQLVQSMANDEEVIEFMYRSLQIGFVADIKSVNEVALTPEQSALHLSTISKANVSGQSIKTNYPEFAALNYSERKEILIDVATIVFKPENMAAHKLGSCLWNALRGFLICESITGAWTITKYCICMAAVLGADMLNIEIIMAQGDLWLFEEETKLEHQACVKIATGLFSKTSFQIVCPGYFVEHVWDCTNG